MFDYYCLNPISPVGTSQFSEYYAKTEDINEAEGILVRSAAMHDMEFSKNLLCVARAGAGVNNIPLDRCAENGIVVFNTPGANANGVKELVICAMLLASRDVVGGINWVNANVSDEAIAKTAEKEKKNFAGTEILGKKLGIIGLGAIGVKLANCAKHLGMEVYGYDPYISVDAAWSLSRDVKHVKNIEEIYKECDFISIHVPLMESTKNYINADSVAMMKDGVVVLNFARDLLCDEKAILAAVDAGKIKKYVSDFPNPTTVGHKNVIVIPHLGASTEEAEDNCAVMAVKEMMDYLENGNIRNSVNYPNTDLGVCETVGRVAVLHKNVANMITQFTGVFGNAGINIANMVNKSKGDYAYTVMDTEDAVTAELVEKLVAVEGVYRVRVIK